MQAGTPPLKKEVQLCVFYYYVESSVVYVLRHNYIFGYISYN